VHRNGEGAPSNASATSEQYGKEGGKREEESGGSEEERTYGENNNIIPNNIKYQPRKQDTSRTTQDIEC
jgi:hypothetical protein